MVHAGRVAPTISVKWDGRTSRRPWAITNPSFCHASGLVRQSLTPCFHADIETEIDYHRSKGLLVECNGFVAPVSQDFWCAKHEARPRDRPVKGMSHEDWQAHAASMAGCRQQAATDQRFLRHEDECVQNGKMVLYCPHITSLQNSCAEFPGRRS